MNRTMELNRKHLAHVFLDFCQRQSGGDSVMVVTVGRKKIVLSDLSVKAICRCLTDSFEVKCYQEIGRENALKQLADTYSDMLNRDNTKLTPDGIEFMTAVMTNSVEIALKKPKDNTFGLEMC